MNVHSSRFHGFRLADPLEENETMNADNTGVSVQVTKSRRAAPGHERHDNYEVAIVYTGDSAQARILRAQLEATGRHARLIQVNGRELWPGF
jgi:hypothetical protein